MYILYSVIFPAVFVRVSRRRNLLKNEVPALELLNILAILFLIKIGQFIRLQIIK